MNLQMNIVRLVGMLVCSTGCARICGCTSAGVPVVHTCVTTGLPVQDEIKDDETHMRKLDEEVRRRQGLLQGTSAVYQGLIRRMNRHLVSLQGMGMHPGRVEVEELDAEGGTLAQQLLAPVNGEDSVVLEWEALGTVGKTLVERRLAPMLLKNSVVFDASVLLTLFWL